MKKSVQTTILDSFKLLKVRSVRKFKMISLAQIGLIKWTIPKLVQLSMGRLDRIQSRIRMTNNLVQFVQKMSKHHGDEFTIKWLKCSSVALQKYLAGEPLSSLRSLEPKVPLPRLINGCPAIINRRDRQLIREGNTWVIRFWLTNFAIYRILKFDSRLNLDSIIGPYSGSVSFLLTYIRYASEFNPFLSIKKDVRLTNLSFLLSHKSSPSNSMSYKGLLTDYHILKYGSWDISVKGEPREEWVNITYYIDILRKAKYNLRRWDSLLYSLDSLLENVRSEGLKLPIKSSIFGTGLSQFAIKQEAAGKMRIFALLDSITQSVLRPLHDSLFDILRKIPNDGTFDQDGSVNRSIEKMAKYGVAYSLDLSSATDRLPVRLTSRILETILGIEGFGEAWRRVIVERNFSFSSQDQVWGLEESRTTPYYMRYSVGQPMGGLSSWAGLAITHHWILQQASRELGVHFEGGVHSSWDTRYEILGDDIVIFNKELALKYIEIMKGLGVGLNLSKSLSDSHSTFEFAKRTIHNGTNVSGLSFQQLISSTSLGSRVSDAFSYINLGLVRSASHLGQLLVGKNSTRTSFRKMSEVGLPAISFFNLLFSKEMIELRMVMECIVNPQFEDFDFEKARFDLPLHSLLRYSLDLVNFKANVISGLKEPEYPFSQREIREEFSEEYEPHLVAVILQEALAKAKTLVRSYESLVKIGAITLYKGKGSKILEAQFQGFFLDLIFEFEDLDIADFADEVEDQLYRHAKYPLYTIPQALSTLDKVESLIFKFTFKTEVSRSKYEKDSSPILKLIRKSEGRILIPYWQSPILD